MLKYFLICGFLCWIVGIVTGLWYAESMLKYRLKSYERAVKRMRGSFRDTLGGD